MQGSLHALQVTLPEAQLHSQCLQLCSKLRVICSSIGEGSEMAAEKVKECSPVLRTTVMQAFSIPFLLIWYAPRGLPSRCAFITRENGAVTFSDSDCPSPTRCHTCAMAGTHISAVCIV